MTQRGQVIQVPDHLFMAKAQRAAHQNALLELRANLAAGIHKELVAKVFSFGRGCLPGDEWKRNGEEHQSIPIEEARRAVAQEAVAQAEALMRALGIRIEKRQDAES